MGTHGSFIFRGCNPHSQDLKPSFFMALGSKGTYIFISEAFMLLAFLGGG